MTLTTSAGALSRWRAWVLAARPATLTAALVPVAVGSATAWRAEAFAPRVALIALAAALLIQIGTNFANDVFDFESGADTAERLGPARATQTGLIEPHHMRRAIIVTFGLASLLGVFLIARGGWPIAALGVLSLFAGYAYTAPPFRLGYRGWGDVLVFLFFGVFAVAGTHYVETLSLSPLVVAASLAVGCTATAILVVNNLRDLATDRAAGKRTLAVRLGERATRRYFAVLLAAAYAPPLAFALGEGPGAWLVFLSAPWAWKLVQMVARGARGVELNAALIRCARLHAAFGLLWAAGLCL